ncbi:hypothetical protein EIKCOROL_00860 [Eikenella corrodens ATCC 23834]|uniref:Uncharacterized protein n=1 Tax=Eikenella corrodens ATCC 23834 TaxID=546274 RepID=C0DU29_EIKCO|nr:hypothetical protein EIKCOROL_00860 [Eikenella corrodens ATCC 23834]
MAIRNKHFQVAFCWHPDCAWRRKLFVWKGGMENLARWNGRGGEYDKNSKPAT